MPHIPPQPPSLAPQMRMARFIVAYLICFFTLVGLAERFLP